jgi:hypothetical protein
VCGKYIEDLPLWNHTAERRISDTADGTDTQLAAEIKHRNCLYHNWTNLFRTISFLKNAVFCDVTSCGSCKNRSFGRMYRLHHQGDRNRRIRNNVSSDQKVAANVVPTSPIPVTLMMVIRSSETVVLARAIRRNIPDSGFLHSHRHENLKTNMALTG